MFRLREEVVLPPALGPEHLFDRGLEHLHARFDRRTRIERADAVVLQERRGGPEADERRRPREAAAAAGQRVVVLGAGQRIAQLDRSDRRQILVGLRREVVPDVAGDRVGRDRAADVGLHQRRRHAQLGREEVVLQEIVGEHDLAHRRLEGVGLGPRPVACPSTRGSPCRCSFSMSRPGGSGGSLLEWQRAHRSAKTVLPRRSESALFGQVGRAAGRVLQVVRIGAGQEEARHVRRLLLGGLPVDRVLSRVGDLDRRDRLAADERPEVEQPLLAEEADVEVDAIERAERADRIGAVLQHPRRPRGRRRREELRQRIGRRHEVVELPVVETAARDRFLAPLLGEPHARPEVVHRVHRPRIVDVVGRDERRVERARQRGVQRLVEEALLVGVALPVEDPIPPEELRADVRAEILPAWILRIGRRLDRIRADVAERARHADAVRLHQVPRLVVARVAVVALRVPLLARLLVEVRIREQPQADDAGGLAVVRADRNRLAASADLDALVLVGVGERIGRAGRIADVEPESVAIRIGSGRLLEARFVDEPEIVPAGVAGIGQRRMRGDRLEEIERAEALAGEHVPEPIVAAGPDEPHVAPFDLLLRERQAAIHVVEVVFVRGREARRGPFGAHRLVEHGAWLRLVRVAGGRGPAAAASISTNAAPFETRPRRHSSVIAYVCPRSRADSFEDARPTPRCRSGRTVRLRVRSTGRMGKSIAGVQRDGRNASTAARLSASAERDTSVSMRNR